MFNLICGVRQSLYINRKVANLDQELEDTTEDFEDTLCNMLRGVWVNGDGEVVEDKSPMFYGAMYNQLCSLGESGLAAVSYYLFCTIFYLRDNKCQFYFFDTKIITRD